MVQQKVLELQLGELQGDDKSITVNTSIHPNCGGERSSLAAGIKKILRNVADEFGINIQTVNVSVLN